jgi:hypothetical protein
MATEWGFKCIDGQCRQREGWWDGKTMFEMLKNRAEKKLDYPICNLCGHHSDIHFTFAFGLKGKLLDCFYPSENVEDALEWEEGGQKWRFYPFLVFIDPDDKKIWGLTTYSWLPYWHVVGIAEEKKYGQWAPCMSIDILADLLRQARERSESYKL